LIWIELSNKRKSPLSQNGLEWGTQFKKKPHLWQTRPEVGHPPARDDALRLIKLRTLGGPLRLGHRGARYVRALHENTVPSFDRALADGCDGFEFDVRLTADGKAVVGHDATYFDRELGNIEIARAKAKQLAGLPRFEDILQRYQRRGFLDIELKVEGLEKITLKLLEEHPPQRGYMVTSFLPQVIEWLRRRDREMPLGLICETRKQLARWKDVPCQYVIVHHELLSPRLIGDVQVADREVLVWTVNETYDMRVFANWGVDGIISDETSLLARILR
jgi:glycerophosphoryl diester phosphodiesterase